MPTFFLSPRHEEGGHKQKGQKEIWTKEGSGVGAQKETGANHWGAG